MKHIAYILAVALVCCAGQASAAEPACAPGWMPRWLCVCPDTCCKPLPCVDWDWKCRCDDYCKKPLPCVDYCLKVRCDDYVCKPAPCCYPKPLCPVR